MKAPKRFLAAAAAVAFGLTLGACSSPADPGTAVESLGVRYTEADVTEVTEDMGVLVGQGLSRDDAVLMLAVTQPYLSVGKELGITAESAEVAQMVEETLSAAGTTAADISPQSVEVLVGLLVGQMIGPAAQADPELGASLDALLMPPNTVVNPRYFSISPENGITPAGPLADVIELGGAAELAGVG